MYPDAGGDDDLAPIRPLPAIDQEAFQQGFGESLQQTIDLSTWTAGTDLHLLYSRTEADVRDAVKNEEEWRRQIRAEVFPEIGNRSSGAPPCAGVYQARLPDLERIHRGLLFNGGVEACDGTQKVIDTIPVTIYQIGVSLTSYSGNQLTLGNRMFRRDLRVASGDPVGDLTELLRRRDQRGGLNQPSQRDTLSELARRGIMAYAERAILLRHSNAVWRMGHGSPAPYELLTGSGHLDLMIEGTKVVRELVESHQKFVYVASEPGERLMLTIGNALRPLEYAIVDTLGDRIDRIVSGGHYRQRVNVDKHWDGEELEPDAWIQRFRDVVAPKVVVGVYRATSVAPAQLFYAHVDHAHKAAQIAIADSILQEHRGFPMLIDMADNVCRSVFGGDSLSGPVSSGFIDAGAPFQYASERTTRRM